MKVAIHQPNFLPWLGFFQKLAWSDTFVLFDDVQTPRGKSFVNRVKISQLGREAWLTVPVTGRGSQPMISDLLIDNSSNWRRKVLGTLKVSYQKTPYFTVYFPQLEALFDQPQERIYSLNEALIRWVCLTLGLTTRLVPSSTLKLDAEVAGEAKILGILKALSASSYLTGSGEGSKRYLVQDHFDQNKISLVWQNYTHPCYPQFGPDFISHLSIVDALFHCGPEQTHEYLKALPQ